MRARASRTHTGHSESVERGQPSAGLERSELLRSGAGAHAGWKGRLAIRRLMNWNAGHVSRAPPVSNSSIGLNTFIQQPP